MNKKEVVFHLQMILDCLDNFLSCQEEKKMLKACITIINDTWDNNQNPYAQITLLYEYGFDYIEDISELTALKSICVMIEKNFIKWGV